MRKYSTWYMYVFQLIPDWAQDISGKLLRQYKTEPEITRAVWRHKKYILKKCLIHIDIFVLREPPCMS